MVVRTLSRACAVLVVALVMTSQAAAQNGVTLKGRLLNSLNATPLSGATVQIDELRRQTTSEADGTFTFESVPPGTYHLSVLAQGYSTRRTEVRVAADAPPIELQVDFDLHFEEVVSVSGDARSQFDTFQPTSVLAGQELSKQLEMSLGATLESQPGVAARSFGPAPARPVIRGLDGDRVLILQDGQRLGDLSSQSGDHGVSINPAAAQKIEVVRGPATLLYGANAIGGLVNVITDEIPTKPMMGVSGNLTFDLGSAASEGGAAGDVHVGNGKLALHLGAGGHRSGDVDTPEGEVVNSQSRNGFGNVGLSWTGANSYFGGSYGYDDTKYGIPVIEEGQVQLTPRRHAFSLRAGGQGLEGAFDSYRATLAIRRYKHDELEGEQVGTAFTNNTEEIEVMGSHRALGRLKGSVGGWVLNRAFDATGEEALSPAVDQQGFAAFLYEEVTWPHVTFQFGGRLDHTGYQPNGEPDRSFTTGSGSLGLLVRPAAADDRLTIAFSAARAARSPALEELFYYGSHPGNFAFEVGNPDLHPEHALGFDVSLRWRTRRVTGELTYFRNDVNGYLFRAPPPRKSSTPGSTSSPRGSRVATLKHEWVKTFQSWSTWRPTAFCRASRRTPTFSSRHRSPWSSGSITCTARSRLKTSRCRECRRCDSAEVCVINATRFRREAICRSSRLRIVCSQPRRRRTDTSWGASTRRTRSVRAKWRIRSRRGWRTSPTSCTEITCP